METEKTICELTVCIPPDTANLISELSRILGMSKSEIVQIAVDDMLQPVIRQQGSRR